jgi:hypothetical protein
VWGCVGEEDRESNKLVNTCTRTFDSCSHLLLPLSHTYSLSPFSFIRSHILRSSLSTVARWPKYTDRRAPTPFPSSPSPSLDLSVSLVNTHTHEHTLSLALLDSVTVEVKRPRGTVCSVESRCLIGCAADPFDQSGSRFKGSEVDDREDRRLPIGGLRLREIKMSTQKITILSSGIQVTLTVSRFSVSHSILLIL